MDDKRKLLLSLLAKTAQQDSAPESAGIAIVGVAGRYPLARTVDELWDNLAHGRHCIREVPAGRWDAGAHRGHSNSAGFIDGVDEFDPLFFQISPADAESIDPQERLFLQTAAAVLDDAGHPAAELAARGPVGVFAGVMNSNYEWMGGEATALGVRTDAHSNHWSIANRVSYTFDFTGPSLAIDTACSASLTAIHLACESIRSGECHAAIAGGVNLILHPMHLRTLAERGMISPGDRLRSFGAGADGFVDGEGVGAVLLRPLDAAIADGDRILGVIRGSAINAGGKTGGYTVPSTAAQAEVIRAALRRAALAPENIGYVEAHGTGTPLGDPIEIAGLVDAFGGRITAAERARRGRVAAGSVKSTIGHLESAAGIAGLTKVLLQFRHGTLVPSLDSTRRNPDIDFDTTPFEIQQTREPWTSPRRAIVNSFGGGGANACVVVEEYSAGAPQRPEATGEQLLVLSAKTEERLRVYAHELAAFLRRGADDGLQRCLRAAAQAIDVEPAALDPDIDLAECGFGVVERARFHALLGAETNAAIVAAHTVREVALALGGTAGTDPDAPRLDDVAHTLQSGRTAHEFRLALSASSVVEAAELLGRYALGDTDPRVRTGCGVRSAQDQPMTTPEEIAVAWVGGARIDWSRIADPSARRIALPGYPFARDRYWIPTPAVTAPAVVTVELPEFYRPLWVRTDQPTTPVAARRIVALVTASSRWLGDAIAAHCPNATVDLVRIGEAPVETGPADLVVHLGGVGVEMPDDLDELDDQLRRGSLALLDVVQQSEAARIVVVTSDVYSVAGSVGRNPMAAGLHGLLQVVPKERPQLRVDAFDFASAEIEDVADLVAAILAEPTGRDHDVALRGGLRYVRRLGRVELPALRAVFREGGVYLLVGGTGGIGVELSRRLAAVHRARIVWFSRSEPDAAQRAAMAEIRSHGGDVVHVAGDAGSVADLAGAVATAHRRFGALHGVVHAAMAFDNHPLAELDEATFRAATRAKIEGSAALAEALADESLDFLVYFSSAGSFGNFAGNGAYICASATEDAYALALRERLPFPVSVINQGYWGQVGSGAQPGLAEIFTGLGIDGFSAEAGIAAVETILGNRLPQVLSIRAGRRALEAMGHDPALDGEVLAGGRPATLAALADLPSAADVAPEVAQVIAGYAELEAVATPLLLGVYQRLGVFHRAGERHSAAELRQRLGILDKFARLHDALLHILTEAGFLTRDGDRISTTAEVESPAPTETEFDRLTQAYPDIEATITLNRLFLESYPRILRGEVGATEIMFPGSSMKLVQNFYRGNPLTDSFNLMVRDAVRAFLPSDGPIHVVELGAGTGATSERVLPVLAEHPDQATFTFTDISPHFVEHGRERFASAYPFARFQPLNLDREPAEQGFEPAGADLVVATNVVHATRNLRATLRRAKALLKPGGWLVLNELTSARPLLTIGGGVLEGWWSFEDAELRIPDSPLASPQGWARLLGEEGFGPVRVFGRPELGQTVLLAESDGVVPHTAPAAVVAPTPVAGSADAIGERLRELVERVLKLNERIDPDRPLADYGFDSLSGMKIVAAADEAFGVSVPLGDFFERPTLRELTVHLMHNWLADATVEPEQAAPVPVVSTPVSSVLRPRTDREQGRHPLSEGQRALWVIEQVAPGNYAYNLPLALWFADDLDVPALRVVLQDLLDRHDELRASLGNDEHGPFVRVAAEPELPFQQVFLTTVSEPDLRDRMQADLRVPFDLAAGPLVRATLYTLGDGRNALLLAFHHLVFDGVSIAALLTELARGYRVLRAGRPLDSERPAHTFAEFVEWQRELLAGPEGARLRNYWTARLADRATTVALPLDRPRPAIPGFHGASIDGHIPAEVTQLARALAGAQQNSLFSVVLAAWFAVLHRYSDQADLAVGTPTMGRPPTGYDDVLGYFMNMVVLAEHVEGQDCFGDLVRRLHRAVLDALDHSAYPLVRLAQDLKGAAPFNVACYFQNWTKDAQAGSIVLGPVEGVHQEGEFELTLEFVEQVQGCRYTLKYDSDLFDEATVRRIGDRFATLLAAAVRAPETSIDLLVKEELVALTGPHLDYPADVLVWDLVRRQAQARPNAIAVRDRDTELTYAQLVARVEVLAVRLTAAGVGTGRTVGVLLPRDADLPAALLAVQASGGVAVPLDPAYPAERLAYMAQDAALHLMLTHSSVTSDFSALPRLVVDTDQAPPALPSPGPATPTDPAYVIYTSGSTGRPKGVQVAHRALVNLLWSMAREPGFGPSDTLFALTTVCFDISNLELYLPLITGGTVHVVATEDSRDGVRLRDIFERGNPTVIQATPSTWAMVLAAGWSGDAGLTVFCGGEALPSATADALLTRSRAVWNLYGPTETTIWSTVSRLRAGERLTIGKPIANTRLYILDSSSRPVPTGVAGELYIGGDGVAMGYLGKPDLTVARFPADPAGDRMYRTGDLVRLLPDGDIEYLGRIDSQVKIRGFRVELEEIETTLLRVEGVREAVVVARGQDAGSHTLLACYVLADGAAEPTTAQLAAWLPRHMMPDALVRVTQFPRTLNEKIDRGALSALPLAEIRARFGLAGAPVAASTGRFDALIGELAEMVSALAGVPADQIGAHTPLGEVGMNSVSFTALAAALRKAHDIEVYPTLFYRLGTLHALAEHLSRQHSDQLAAHVPAAEPPPAESRDVAIIGMAGRLPGSADLAQFWEHLVAGDDLITEIPADRWDWREQPRSRSRWGGFAPDIDRFDAAFFGISPREAELMDPQQRLVLELVWSAVEDAGYRPSELAGRRVGVFVGVTNSDYLEVQRDAGQAVAGHTLTGVALSIIPNRVSYLLDLRGPSMAIDTACSSSLTAVQQACAALRDGTCELAIAGGVSLILSPGIYEALSQGEMLSPDGRCKTFDSRADGYVRGEGAGVVLLKPNAAAEHDGDAVHAVIKAVAINHGGRTTSLTAPNPDAQADLLVEAYRAADVPPATVGYIDAHGTGTALGDPIETAGLNTAFQRMHAERGDNPSSAIAIGSVKTNIGHLEGAAGIAGLFKVVLALRHGVIPASLHFQARNPYLELDGGPFEVADTTRAWPRPTDAEGAELPRRAGVSSFGFGGANAHVVLAEPSMVESDPAVDAPRLVVLSARDRDALRRSARRLVDHLTRQDVPLADLAHTLQAGREPMRHRLAVLVPSTAALRTELDAFLAGEPSAVATEGTEPGLTPSAAEWLRGADIDWPASACRRVHLPSYPFAGPRHWVAPGTATASPARLHPTLLDANVSTLGEQKFSKTLTGAEFFLRDHVIAGARVLAGAAYLDMGRLAGELSSDGRPVSQIDDLVWTSPIQLAAQSSGYPLVVTVTGDREQAAFEVRGEARHASGRVRFGEPADRPGPMDPAALRALCAHVTSGADCYAEFDRLGFAYGPSLRVIEEIAEGPEIALATLRRTDADAAGYVFHPALFDAAIQVAGRLRAAADPGNPLSYRPFSISSIRRYAPLPERVLAYVRPAPGIDAGFDITLLDPAGAVLAELDAFTLRAAARPESVAAFEPVWQSAPLPAGNGRLDGTVLLLGAGPDASQVRTALAACGARVVIASEFDAATASGPVSVVHLADGDPVEHGFHAAREFLRAWPSSAPLRYLYVHPDPAASPAQPAMAAFGRSVHLEHPAITFTALAIGTDSVADTVSAELAGSDSEVRVGRTGRARRAWRQVTLPVRERSAFTGTGAQIITGGTGAIGLLVAEHLAARRRAAGVSEGGIVLVARSSPRPEALARAEAISARVVRADITDPSALDAVLGQARRDFGSVCGVVHAAGVLRDGLLRGADRTDTEAVLAAKIDGTVLLDEATRHDPLDYFVAFSSAAAAFGNVGQSAYAFANAFLDHFAQQRERQRAEGLRRGRTLAAAWPVWADGGMRVDAAAQRDMERALGMRPVRTEAALEALERALATDAPALLLAPGDPDRILAALTAEPARQASAQPVVTDDGARQRAEELVLRLLAEELKLPESEIIVTEPFDRHGVDSLISISMTRRLEEQVGPLSKTLFFEYVTVRELAEHLAAAHPAAFGATPPVEALVPHTLARSGHDGDIAIIGVAGRYPQADDVDEFWRNLREGRDSVEEIPADRWDHGLFYDPDRSVPGKTYGRWGGFVRGADRFDPLFFRMSQIEAEHTDPQLRVFLETVWHLLEDAGYTREQLRGRHTGVFVGMMYGDYQLYGVQDALRGNGSPAASSYASVANRVSYFFDFTGPSVALDTMCSSSLVTIHEACLAIRNGDCEVAVAGGVNIASHPVKFLQLAQRGFLAEDGRCRSFGEGGTGYVPAEGSGAVLLKRLDAAVADGDRILAVVKASAVNHGGAGRGYSVPNPKAQGDLVRTALDRAGLRPSDLDYLEAHGTGTALGDPVEVNGMLRAFEGDLPKRLPIGSVKSNIGHAESAAGVAAITKVLLQFRHGELVSSLHSDRLNPNIDFASTPLRVQRERAPWPRRVQPDGTPRPRTAGVSSFGAGGTNAHVLLQEYLTEPTRISGAAGPQLAVLSARDADRLVSQARRLAAHLDDAADGTLPEEVAWTLQIGREGMAHRLAVLFRDLPELATRLGEFATGGRPAESWTGVVDPRRPGTADRLPADPAVYAVAWTSGQLVDFAALHGTRPARVALPGYPFEGDRIWLAAADAELAALTETETMPEIPTPAPEPEPAGVSAQEAVTEWLLGELAETLGFDRAKLSGDVPVQDYGLESLMLAQLAQNVAKRLDVPVDPSALLEYPTIDGFAGYLAEEHGERMRAVFGPTEPAPPRPAPAPAPVGIAVPVGSEIAVVGMSARFAGAESVEEYWELLRQGRSALRPIPAKRFGSPLGFHAGLLPDVLRFDPAAFLLDPGDVAAMDPQALLLLEEVRNAVHNAGYGPAELKGRRIGVYVGGRADHTPDPTRLQQAQNPAMVTGQNYLAANVSQFFDLQGPSLVVDTACSSALVAMDMAVRALRAGDVESAVVAGVSLLGDDRAYQVFGWRGLLNPDSEFHLFDQRAAGLMLGEGIGVVVLKPLATALADGDRVLAVLKGIAVNNGGRTAGPATPNLQALKNVMTEALAGSGLRPHDVGWVETNGSGSNVTDLLELKAVQSVYRAGDDAPLALGCVKPNIGHPLTAEGIAAFIKVVLMLQNHRQVPFLSGQQPLQHFDVDASALYFPRDSAPWPAMADVAALNCFADGGTNTHLLLAPAPAGHHAARAPLAPPALDRRTVIRGTEEPVAAGMFWDTYR